jgi:hypothetical protein
MCIKFSLMWITNVIDAAINSSQITYTPIHYTLKLKIVQLNGPAKNINLIGSFIYLIP